jgi:hypothetical protein
MLGNGEEAAVAIMLDCSAQKGRDRDTPLGVYRVQRMPPEQLPFAHSLSRPSGRAKFT